jgi:hypothetical protein
MKNKIKDDNNSKNSEKENYEENSRYNKMIISTLVKCLQGFKDKENETMYNEVRNTF